MRRTRFLARTLLSSPAVVFVYTPLLVSHAAAGMAMPFATGRFIDALLAGGLAPVGAFVVLAALLMARAAVAPGLQRLLLSRARDIELRLQERALEAIMELSPAELSAHADGELVAKLTRDTCAVGTFVSGLYQRLTVAAVTMFGAGLALHTRSAALGWAFVAFIPLAVALFLPFAKRFASNSHTVRKTSDVAFSTLFDFFRSLPFLRTLDAERRFADAPRTAFAELKAGNCGMDRLGIAFSALLGAILVTGEVAVLGCAGALAARGAIPVGDVVACQMLFIAAMQSVQGLVALLPETATLREAIDSLDEILSKPPRRLGARGSLGGGASGAGRIETIEFRNVTFSYPGAQGLAAVKDFSATFRAGRTYALTGANGSGKTTLLKLATAALEPQAGVILVNGVPVGELDEGAFRRAAGIVFQDSLAISATVRDNITLRDPSFSAKDIEAAIAASGFGEVVERLRDGLDTHLGLRGQMLSGGELQRLAIARAIVRNPSVLVLDEVTNHLDAKARAAFTELLRKLTPGRIVLLVSHDEEIVEMCDEKILVRFRQKASYINV